MRGVYRRVRNPMLSGVFFVLVGKPPFWVPHRYFVWFLVAFAANALYIPLIEEPDLSQRFGEEYLDYKRQRAALDPPLETVDPRSAPAPLKTTL